MKNPIGGITILLGLLLAFLPISTLQAQQAPSPKSRIDSLNERRLAPSFLLWQTRRTSPLYPYRNPFSTQKSPFFPSSPVNRDVQVLMDSTLKYQVMDQLDSTRMGNQQEYDFDKFAPLQEFQVRQDYWKTRSRGIDGESAVEGRRLIPPITMSPTFDRIFGGDSINIIPTGYVNLDFGAIFRRIDNPTIPIRQQKNGNFNFQFRPTLSYVINRSLNLTVYFERTVNDPRVTTAFRRSNTAFGGQLRFNLSQ